MRDTSNIILFSISRLISELGTAVFKFALSLYVLDITGSASLFATVLGFTFLPGILVNIFAGVYVDRSNKKKVMIISDFASGILILICMVIFSYYPENIFTLILYAIALSTIQAFFSLAVNACIPDLVSKDRVNAMNSSHQGINALLSIFGPVVGAIAYSMIGFHMIFLIDGISFIVSGILILFLKFRPRSTPAEKHKPYFESLREIRTYIRDRAAIKNILLVFLATNFVIGPAISLVLPYIIYKQFQMSAEQLSLIEAALAVGFIVGAITIAMKRVHSFFINKIFVLIQLQALMFTLWIFPKLPFIGLEAKWGLTFGYMLLLAFTGIFLAMGNIPMTSYAQLYIPEKIRASFFGVVGTVTTLAVPVGMWIYGVLIDLINFSFIVIGSGLLLFIVGTIAHRNKDLREFFKQDLEPEPDDITGTTKTKTIEA
ncbi:MFS transporter [Paenibacillus lutrae]|uniref:MFS transporter n=1 Tax=Paenibacillus lutrae TaxID=2078573 RepID=A0A7X3JY84_9BACL|nr:MFS transporter [Paenibacillus lutrae]MVO98791.1 MFS transporter [Paenibacillus lutrae]